jgi:hypothetical protein
MSKALNTLLNIGQIGVGAAGAASGNPMGAMMAAQGVAGLMGDQTQQVNPTSAIQSNYSPSTGIKMGSNKGSLSPISTASYTNALQRRLEASSRQGDGTSANDYIKDGIAALNESNIDPQTKLDMYRKLQAGLARA